MSFPPFDLPFAVNDALLLGSIVLLIVSVSLRAVRRPHEVDTLADAPDLRSWKNPQTELGG